MTSAILMLLICSIQLAAAGPRDVVEQNILLLHSYSANFQWTREENQGIESVLYGKANVHLFTEYMNVLAFYDDPGYRTLLKKLYAYRYRKTRWRGIVVSDDIAYQFALRWQKELFQGAPIVFCGVNYFNPKQLSGHPNVTGVVESFDKSGTMDLILRLQPAIKKVVFISNLSSFGLIQSAETRQLLQVTSRYRHLAYEIWEDYTLNELYTRLGRLNSDTVVFYLSIVRDRNNRQFRVDYDLPKLSQACAVPVYSNTSNYLGLGIVGGSLKSGYFHGREAGLLMERILNGANAHQIPVRLQQDMKPMFDYTLLHRFHLPIQNVPPDAVIINQPVSIYQVYRNGIIVISVVIAVLALLVGLLSINILHRYRVEAAHRESEERFRVLVEQAPEVILVLDTETKRFTEANPVAERFFGCSIAEIKTLGPKAFINPMVEESPAVLELIEDNYSRVLAGESVCYERTVVTISGEQRICEVRLVRLPSSTKKLIRASIIDITESKKADQERRHLEEQLAQSQKMEAVGQLAGGVAHDFNNMLGVIIGYAEMSLEQVDETHPLHANLSQIQKAALRSANLTRQLLAFARKQTIDPKLLDLNCAVEGTLAMLRRVINENIELIWLPDPKLQPVKLDSSQIDQILANLIINARDAIEGVGRITIRTENVQFSEEYCHSHPDCLPGDYVQLSVLDTGAGIDQAVMKRLFEPFFTTKAVGKGTGLGLATVYGAVKQNGGFITVLSEPSSGAEFRICLPGVKEDQHPMNLDPEIDAVRGQETVLLVEDEPMILEMGMAILERMGYTVLCAYSPDEALSLARDEMQAIDLLITDVVMPSMNGRELRDRLTALRPEIKTLFMSGYTSDIIAENGVIDQGVAFLQKPFTSLTLGEKVRQTLRHESRNEFCNE